MTFSSSRLPEVALPELAQVHNNDLHHLALTSFSHAGLGLAPGGISGQPQLHLIAPCQPGKALGCHPVAMRADKVVAAKAPACEGAAQVLTHASMLALSLGPLAGRIDARTSLSKAE